MTDDYDGGADAFACWHLAVQEIRKRGVLEGRFAPRNDEERAWLAESSGMPKHPAADG